MELHSDTPTVERLVREYVAIKINPFGIAPHDSLAMIGQTVKQHQTEKAVFQELVTMQDKNEHVVRRLKVGDGIGQVSMKTIEDVIVNLTRTGVLNHIIQNPQQGVLTGQRVDDVAGKIRRLSQKMLEVAYDRAKNIPTVGQVISKLPIPYRYGRQDIVSELARLVEGERADSIESLNVGGKQGQIPQRLLAKAIVRASLKEAGTTRHDVEINNGLKGDIQREYHEKIDMVSEAYKAVRSQRCISL